MITEATSGMSMLNGGILIFLILLALSILALFLSNKRAERDDDHARREGSRGATSVGTGGY